MAEGPGSPVPTMKVYVKGVKHARGPISINQSDFNGNVHSEKPWPEPEPEPVPESATPASTKQPTSGVPEPFVPPTPSSPPAPKTPGVVIPPTQ